MRAFEGLPEQRGFSDVTAGREEMLEGKEEVFGGEPELTNYAIVEENIELACGIYAILIAQVMYGGKMPKYVGFMLDEQDVIRAITFEFPTAG